MNKEETLNHVLTFHCAGMSRNELGFLYDFCREKDVLELGSFYGMSSYAIASTAKCISCVDVWSDTFEHLSHDNQQQTIYKSYNLKDVFEQFNNNCKVFIDSGKIKVLRGNTIDLHSGFQNNDYDVVLIDADHSYHGVSTDFSLYKNKVKNDGFIVFHDYGDCMWTAIKQFCDLMVQQKVLELVTVFERIAVCRLLEVN